MVDIGGGLLLWSLALYYLGYTPAGGGATNWWPEVEILEKAHQPFLNWTFGKQQLAFCSAWYAKFPWLNYQEGQDKVYCLVSNWRPYPVSRCLFKNNFSESTSCLFFIEKLLILLRMQTRILRNGSKGICSTKGCKILFTMFDILVGKGSLYMEIIRMRRYVNI